ncbi:MAG: hypothetical protein FWC26_09660 [Fibromonadales bacterium]|nr:hypothetical protein [Fibromonadales bacterium]
MREEILKIYHDDLWKDKRIINPRRDIFIKYSENALEKDTEVSVIQFLHKSNIEGIPNIIKITDKEIHLSCFKGIRIFELLVQLDELKKKGLTKAQEIKELIISRCIEKQKRIQHALFEWRKTQSIREPYPQFKLSSIIKVLAYCTKIRYNVQKTEEELKKLNYYWKTLVSVPFRDATTKNMVFCSDKLSRIEFMPTDDKTQKERDIIESKLDDDYFWNNTLIGDFDFSSCIHDTTLEDDLISIKFHERTFCGNSFVEPSDVIWFGEPNGMRAAISFYIRYYRFGGRKAAYRILNPVNHMVRFRYDTDIFYFFNLNTIMRNLWKDVDSEFPQLLDITEKLSRTLGTNREEIDSFYEIYPNANREPWDGMADVPK